MLCKMEMRFAKSINYVRRIKTTRKNGIARLLRKSAQYIKILKPRRVQLIPTSFWKPALTCRGILSSPGFSLWDKSPRHINFLCRPTGAAMQLKIQAFRLLSPGGQMEFDN